jgi:uncharacterized RDD family membrane protein YckC
VNNQSGAGNPLDERYYVRGEREAYGPYDGRTLKEMIEQGKVALDAGIARVGATEWTTVKEHPFFSSIRPAGAAAAQPMRLPGGPGSGAEYSENVSTTAGGPYHYGGFWIRFCAILIDSVILYIGILIIGLIASALIGFDYSNNGKAVTAIAVIYLFATVMVLAYQIMFLRSGWQATPGKRVLGLRIITTNGAKLSGWRAFGRYVCYSVSAMPMYIGFMMAGWTKEKRSFHDSICDTRVIYYKK